MISHFLKSRVKNLELAFCLSAVLGVALFLIWRVKYGVDFTDEALTYAAPYRFFLGDQPFRDDFFVYQLSSLILYPVLKCFWLISGHTDGTVIFGRYLYLFFSGLVAFSIYYCLKDLVPNRVRVLIALVAWVFVPFKIFALGYNPLAIGFLTFAFFSSRLAPSPEMPRHSIFYFGLGLFQGLGVFAYPSLVLTFVPLGIYFWKKNGIGSPFYYFMGAVLVPIVMFLSFGISVKDFIASAQFIANASSSSGHAWNANQILVLMEEAVSLFRCRVLHLIWILAFLYSVKKKNQFLTLILGILFPVLAFFSNASSRGGPGERGYIIEFAVAGIYFFWLLSRTAEDWKLFNLICIPSMIAGIIFAWSSNNGLPHAALGLFPAALVSQLWLVRLMRAEKSESPLLFLSYLPLVLTLCMSLREDTTVFMDDPLKTLKSPIQNGIFKGLYTSERKKQYWTEMSRLLEKDRERDTGRIAFYPHFPAGYLMTKMRPGTYTVWGGCPEGMGKCVESFKSKSQAPDVFVQVKSLYYNQTRTDVFETPDQDKIVNDLISQGAMQEDSADIRVLRLSK